MGWYMVMSGLVNDPRVSQFRLTAHLGLALVIFAAMFWTALSLLEPGPSAHARPRSLRRFAYALTALVFVMALSGGLVAGIRAGFAYNTFPLMNGQLVPSEILMIDPWYLNFFNNRSITACSPGCSPCSFQSSGGGFARPRLFRGGPASARASFSRCSPCR